MSTENNAPSRLSAINLVENSHHDLGWHKCAYAAERDCTFDEINSALDLMKKDPTFTWTHESVTFIYSYLKAYPERKAELAQRIAEGRFDIGAGYTQPYTSFVTSEMLARQFIYGKKWVEDTFPGYESKIYYNTDVPGLGVQMPQLMKKADVSYLYASRSWNFDGFKRNEYKKMQALDQSQINVFFMHHYTDMFYGDPDSKPYQNHELMHSRINDHLQDMQEKNLGSELPLLLENDCMPPCDQTESIEAWNAYAKENNLPQLKYSTLQAALDQVFTEDADLSKDVLVGEWPSKWFYENSASDNETFLMQREAERYLRTTETLAVIRAIATGNFNAYPAKKLEEAWRACDHSCHGYAPEQCIIDFKEVYQKALDIAKEIYHENLAWLVCSVRTDENKGDISFVVFNNLSWKRSDKVVLEKPVSAEDVFRLVDSDGKEVAYQLSSGGEIVFIAEDVPSMGYKTYYIRNGEAPAVTSGKFELNAQWTEPFTNAYYSVTPVVSGGALESIVDLENNGKSLFAADRFKIGELYDFQYDGMGAGEQLNMWQPHNGVSQLGYFGRWTCVEAGPIRTVFESKAPAAARGPATIRFTVYETLKRVDFDVKFDLDDEGSRQLRLMFPVNAGQMFGADGMIDHSKVKVTYEVPFGAVNIGDEMLPKFSSFNDNTGDPNNVGGGASNPKDFTKNNAVRPREVQNWVQASDADKDLSVCISSYNIGWDYQDPTDNPCKTPVLQPVMISTSKACHWLYGKWLQPGEHAFHFTLTSGCAASTAGHRMNVAVNNPLTAQVQAAPGSLLPETYCGLQVDSDNVVVSAVKKAEDDQKHIVIRWYEAEGCGCQDQVSISLPGTKVTEAQTVNLIERPQEHNTASLCCCGGIKGAVAPWSIETAMVSVDAIR